MKKQKKKPSKDSQTVGKERADIAGRLPLFSDGPDGSRFFSENKPSKIASAGSRLFGKACKMAVLPAFS